MSAYGTFFPYCATPKGSCQHRGRCPHPRSPRGRVQEKPPAPLPQSVGSPPTCKGQAATRFCFASLDRFPAPSASVSLLPPRRWRGSRATKSCILPLTPWNRPNTHRRGRWIGFATCPAASQVRVGFGAKPQACFLFLKLLGWM